jgi:hypothetical protein
MGMIRNISQTAQEREIIKQAPDIVVYIEGLPYLLNPFLATAPNDSVSLVNFNDHITGFNASYAVDNWIPQASVNLSVPNHLKYLYQSPGGNYLLQTMMQIQVYAKGYFFANNGNTLYRRVFKGLISHINYQDDGKSLEISLQCAGIMQFLAMMQIDIHPSIMTNSMFDATAFETVFANLNPYQQIAAFFMSSIFTDGFQINTIAGTSTVGQTSAASTEGESSYFNAIKEGYIAKWQAISQGIGQDVHIYGLTQKEIANTAAQLAALTTRSDFQGTQDTNKLAVQNMYQGAVSESDAQSQVDYTAIRNALPDMSPASVQLLNGMIVNRLDRLRQIVATIFYEGYQDVDGQIIIKPPMYNLDVTNLGSANSDAAKQFQANSPSTDINARTNPFIINLAEIRVENETEDQAAVRCTRKVVQGAWDTQIHVKGGQELLAAAEFVDLAKLAQFGLREEPATQVNWLQDMDVQAVYAYAASELVRSNRGYRTYTVTIPMRPELKLGFPCFIPHKDMYGYINNISINYQIGGDATMTVGMDTLRKRPMFPRPQTSSTNSGQLPLGPGFGNGGIQPGVVYVSQPNLVYKWTSQVNIQSSPTSSQTAPINPTVPPPPPSLAGGSNASSVSDPTNGSSVGDTGSITKAINDTTTSTPDIRVINWRQRALNTYLPMKADTKLSSWIVQNDGQQTAAVSAVIPGQGVVSSEANPITTDGIFTGGVFANGSFSNPRIVDASYYNDLFMGTMPYTDVKGYEIVAPFPWGRYTDLKTALWDFTQQGYIEATAVSNEDVLSLQNVNAFLFAGLETPTASGSTSASDITTALNSLMSGAASPNNKTIIELSYTTTAGTNQTNDSTLLTQPQPDNNQQLDNQLIQNTNSSEQAKIAVFLSGTSTASQTSTQDALAASENPALSETGTSLTE